LLWGRDESAQGPGARPATDYQPAAQRDPVRAAVAQRRGQYLKVASELLVEQLEGVANAWRDSPGSYRAGFLNLPAREALALAIKGMGSLSGAELSGERLTVAYETKDQENEHSCFSDNTDADLAGNALGIQNVCLGRYRRSDGSQIVGPGLCELLARRDPALAKALAEQTAESVRALRAIPRPFDQAMLGSDQSLGRQAIAASIGALQRQTETLTESASVLGLVAARRSAREQAPSATGQGKP
jgi:putative iron-regulated protein